MGERLPQVGFYYVEMQGFSPPAEGKGPVLDGPWELIGMDGAALKLYLVIMVESRSECKEF